MKHPLVWVVWHDAHAVGDTWMNLPISNEPCVVKSCGWLLRDAKPNHIVLAQSYNDDDDYDHLLAIPVGMVVDLQLVLENDLTKVSQSVKVHELNGRE